MGLLAASCAETTSPEENREAAIQTSVIRWIADKHPPATPENPEELPVVFIESLSDVIPIEVQVEIIDRLVDEMTIRFIDSRAEAIDDADPALPIRDGSILIGLGAVPDGPDPGVRAEIYRSLDDIGGYIVEVRSRGGRWVVEGEPEATPAEGLIVVED